MAILEYKTTGQDLAPDGDYWKRLLIDSQVSVYWLAAVDAGLAVQTVLYDVTRKPTIRPRQIPLLDDDGNKVVVDEDGNRVLNANGRPRQSASAADGYVLLSRLEDPDEYGQRLTEDIAARPGFYFARREVTRFPEDIKELEAELWMMQRLLSECKLNGWWPRRTTQCNLTYRCPYLDICRWDGEAVPQGFEVKSCMPPELEV